MIIDNYELYYDDDDDDDDSNDDDDDDDANDTGQWTMMI